MSTPRTASRTVAEYLHRLLLLLLLAGLLAPAGAVTAQVDADDWQVIDDHWYILEMAGTPAGWSNDVVAKRGDQIRTVNRSYMKMKRGAIEIESESESAFIETADGRPVTYESVTKTGQDVVRLLYTFDDDRVLVTGTQGEQRVDNELPWPEGEWLTPYAAQQYFEKRREAGAATIEMRVLIPSQGLDPVGVKSVYQGDQMYEHGHRSLPVTRWNSEMTSMPGMVTTDLISADGHLVYQSVTTGIGELVTRVAEKEEALAAVVGDAPEMMVNTFITPSRDLERFLETKTATFEVRAKNGSLPDMPSVGSQTFERIDEATAKITIDLNSGSAASEDEKTDEANTGSSIMINADDKLIAALARRAVRKVDGDDPLAKARAMRDAAYKHISRKGYETAFASASETAKTRTGDCSEHAVLLAAMLRSQGIPARVATGLVYVPDFDNGRGIFGWHMWTQAMINDEWVDLDATLPGAAHHAGHITTATATLEDGGSETQMNSLMLMIGNLEIDVLEYGY